MKTKKKQRKANLIKALKQELYHYKCKPIPINYITTQLHQYKFGKLIDDRELKKYGTDEIESYVKERLANDFEQALGEIIPIDVEHDDDYRQTRYVVDIWVK